VSDQNPPEQNPYAQRGAGQGPAGPPPPPPGGYPPMAQSPMAQSPTAQPPMAPGGYPPPYAGSPSSGGPSSGLAVTALVLGVIGILGFWIPILNIGVILLAIGAIVVGVMALRGVRAGRQAGKGMAIAGIVLSVLTILGSIAVNLAAYAFVTTARDSFPPGGVVSDLDGLFRDDTTGAVGEPLPHGKPASVGDYEVAVTDVDLTGADAGGESYVVVEVEATYTGTAQGNPYQDLMVAVDGAEGRPYDETTCEILLPEDGLMLRPLSPAATAGYQVCMAVPEQAREGATIVIEPLSGDGESGRWSLD